ncbi:melanocortin receptor 5-like [Rhopilema esculentum]|uniref:melanocortin receptor 5-like n=1 Tax=Rhopilema esculentum TaxID=499914 RepID=UPI0031D2DAB7|eukprot:gene6946-12566_t
MVSCFPEVWAPVQLSYFTATVSIVLSLTVCIGNSFIIIAVVFDPLKKLRTPFSFFLVNLALCDLIVGSITLPTSVAIHLNEARGFVPDNQRLLLHTTFFMSSNASFLSLAMLSLDRFIAIRWPIRYRNSLAFKNFLLISCIIWGFSLAMIGIYFKVGFISYLMVFCHVAIIFTLIVLSGTYHQVNKILRVQWKEFRYQSKENSEKEQREHWRISKEKIITKTFLYIAWGFLLCSTPPVIGAYILQFCDSCDCTFRHVLRDLQFIFISMNSAINPLVSFIRMSTFRHSIAAIICRCKKGNKREDDVRRHAESGRGSEASSITHVPSVKIGDAYVITACEPKRDPSQKEHPLCSLISFKKLEID